MTDAMPQDLIDLREAVATLASCVRVLTTAVKRSSGKRELLNACIVVKNRLAEVDAILQIERPVLAEVAK